MSKANRNIVLVGNPNTGKSTLFNALTGLNQKVGNFPGVTVEKKTGTAKILNTNFDVIDLPGTYSLYAGSMDEQVTKNYIETSGSNDIFLIVTDATNLNRNLLLFTQILDLGKKTILVLNMVDLIERNRQEINVDLLSKLLKSPIVLMNARLNKGLEELKSAIHQFKESDQFFMGRVESKEGVSETMTRIKKINEIVDQCLTKKGTNHSLTLTKKIDNILTHKYAGYAIFLAILFIIFQAIFSWSSYPMEAIEVGFSTLGTMVGNNLPPGMFNDLIVEGIIAGLGGIVIFIPQIAILFAFIAILEDTGYMSRVSFLMDRILRQFGMNGKSIIPLISSGACAVPAIMSARTIGNFKERLITIMVAPLISCSARIPVYTILIALIVPKESSLGIFNLQGLMVMALYLTGFFAALLSAIIMKLVIRSSDRSIFTLEMPTYRSPQWKKIGIDVFSKVNIFLFDAGKIIIAISIILWGLSSFGPGSSFEKMDEKYSSVVTHNSDKNLEALLASEKLERSYAGVIGKSIEPFITPLGFDWKIGVSLITSFAAREVFVGTMATLYSVGDSDNTKSIREKMSQARNPKTGEKLYTTATTVSLLLFYVFAMQCMATLAVVKRETNSIKWPIIQIIYMGSLAYLSSFIAYSILS